MDEKTKGKFYFLKGRAYYGSKDFKTAAILLKNYSI